MSHAARSIPNFAFLFLVMALCVVPAVRSAEPAAPSSSRDPLVESGDEHAHLTGGWGGWRDSLYHRGVHFQAGYVAELMANVSGGLDQGAVYQGLADFALELDLDKLTGNWRGAEVRVSSLWLHGSSPSGRLIGDIQTASNIDAYDSIRLYEAWLDQSFGGDRFALSLRAGMLLADAEFAVNEMSALLFNSSFGWPAWVSMNAVNTGPAYYVTALGARLRIDAGESFFFQTGIYDGDTFDDPAGNARKNRSGTHLHLNNDQGLIWLGEFGWRLNPSEDGAGLPGIYRVGAWWHTADFADLYSDVAGGSAIVSGLPPDEHGDNYGAYFAGEQWVWRESAKPENGLGLFFRAGGAPRDRSVAEWVVDGGMYYSGLFRGRDEDEFAIGIGYVKISGDLRRSERDDRDINGTPYAALSDHETVIETSYRLSIIDGWSVQPSVQWILHPGGSGAVSDAVVFGLRSFFTF